TIVLLPGVILAAVSAFPAAPVPVRRPRRRRAADVTEIGGRRQRDGLLVKRFLALINEGPPGDGDLAVHYLCHCRAVASPEVALANDVRAAVRVLEHRLRLSDAVEHRAERKLLDGELLDRAHGADAATRGADAGRLEGVALPDGRVDHALLRGAGGVADEQ